MADIAVLSEPGRVFLARHSAQPFEPMTATLALIQGIWAVDPKMARKILRTRIYATESSTLLAEGTIRVAAKRWNAGTSHSEIEKLLEEARTRGSELVDVTGSGKQARESAHIEFSPKAPGTDSDWMTQLRDRLDAVPIDPLLPRFERSRAVAAALVLPDDTGTDETGWAVALNQNVSNRTLHAEMILIENWWRRQGCKLPAKTRLFVTLQCCRMCAAAVLHVCENPGDIEVIYGEPDPGPMAAQTMLQKYGRELPYLK